MFVKTKKFISYNRSLKTNVRKLRQNMTAAENKLWYEFLRVCKHRFMRQKAIGNYILDFYCQKLKLGIEIDGTTHIDNSNEEYDRKRTEELSKLGIKVIRFWNNDIFYGLGAVENIIETEIKKKTKPPYPPLKGGLKGVYPFRRGTKIIMQEKLIQLKEEILNQLKNVKRLEAWRELEIKYLGRKGELTKILRSVADLKAEEKKTLGKLANEIKLELVSKFKEARAGLEKDAGGMAVDATLPGMEIKTGHLHPITIIQNEIEDIFTSLGFMI